MPAEIGQEAPDFDLKSSTGENVKLSSFRGNKAVALVFTVAAISSRVPAEIGGSVCEPTEDCISQSNMVWLVLDVSIS